MSTRIITGLGNPGSTYAKNRHNIGFMVLDFFHDTTADEFQWSAWHTDTKKNAILSEGTYQGNKIILVKPQTYMNESGRPVRAVMDYVKGELDQLLVVHDELDLPLSEIKQQRNISSAGHNGIKSLIEHLGSQDFNRVRIGVGKPTNGMEISEYVLKNFGLLERRKLQDMKERASDMITTFITK